MIKIKIHEKEIIYAGEAKNIKTRVKAHLDDKLNKTNSMKFGLRKDIFITDSYDIYYCVTLDRTKLESIIHNDYHTRFGE